MGLRKRLLETPPERVPDELRAMVRSFCEPIDAVRSAYVGLTEVTEDFGYPREQLAVAFELAARSPGTAEGDRQLRLVVDRFYDSMPDEVQDGGCNILEPDAIGVWRERAQQVFAR